MKKIIPGLLIMVFAFSLNAQNIVFKAVNADHTLGDNLPDTVEVVADSLSQIQIIFDCFVSNITSDEKEVKITREIVSYVNNASDQLCWGTCTIHFETDDMVEKPTLTFAANDTKFTGLNDETDYEGLGGAFHYLPMGNAGTTILKYTLISVNGLSEVEEDVLVVKYTANDNATSINETMMAKLSNPYPNPATTYAKIDYNMGTVNNASMTVYNVIGTKIKSFALNESEGTVVVNTSNLPAGLYFVNVEYKGQVIGNRKLMVE